MRIHTDQLLFLPCSKPAGQSPAISRTSADMAQPEAMKRAPAACMRASKYLPAASTLSTPRRSTQRRLLSSVDAARQQSSSSETQAPPSLPSSSSRSWSESSWTVIRNIVFRLPRSHKRTGRANKRHGSFEAASALVLHEIPASAAVAELRSAEWPDASWLAPADGLALVR